jgi:hypothetical protein
MAKILRETAKAVEGKPMNRISKFFNALHEARQREADRVIRRHWHLVEETRAHMRRRGIETADVGTVVSSCDEMELEPQCAT